MRYKSIISLTKEAAAAYGSDEVVGYAMDDMQSENLAILANEDGVPFITIPITSVLIIELKEVGE